MFTGVSTAHHQEVHRMGTAVVLFRWLSVVLAGPGQQT